MPPSLLSIGDLEWYSGYDYLLEALARLRRSAVPFTARVYGTGRLRHAVEFSISDLELSDVLVVMNADQAALSVNNLSAFDVFINASHTSIQQATTQAVMSLGLPIVTTSVTGLAELIRDGIDGYVVPVRDIEALADRIERLLVDPALRERMGKAARQRVESEFLIDRQAEMFERMYQSVVGERVNSHFSDHRA